MRFEACEWAGNRVALHASHGAEVAVLGSRIRGPAAIGLLFRQQATGIVEDTDIEGCVDAAVMINSGATPTLSRCRLASDIAAVYVQNGGLGALRDCTLRGGTHGVIVGAGAAPALWDCRIEGSNSTGLFFEGGGLVERCALSDNGTGIYLMPGADPVIRDCDVNGGLSCGVLALDGARMGGSAFQECRLG